MENGYHLYKFSGELLADAPTEKFKQLLWRPRPPTLLSKEEQKNVRRNLRDYSREFDEDDRAEEDSANVAIVEHRRRLLEEWIAFVLSEKELVSEERDELGLADPMEELELSRTRSSAGEGEQIVEEVIEEVLEETEEFV